ncbi:hypothetical protein ACLMJK_001168 [Lecanora helva]
MPHLGEPIDPPEIDVSSPDDFRSSFRTTDFKNTLPAIRQRFPNIDPLYLTKIFRGTIQPEGLIWLDVDREDASPPDFANLAHMLYCFEIYAQLICHLASPQGVEAELELQRALADYRVRLLKLCKVATFESLRDWHKAYLAAQIKEGQDKPSGWRERREELGHILRRAG